MYGRVTGDERQTSEWMINRNASDWIDITWSAVWSDGDYNFTRTNVFFPPVFGLTILNLFVRLFESNRRQVFAKRIFCFEWFEFVEFGNMREKTRRNCVIGGRQIGICCHHVSGASSKRFVTGAVNYFILLKWIILMTWSWRIVVFVFWFMQLSWFFCCPSIHFHASTRYIDK